MTSDRVTIRAVAAGGDGVATLADGRTVFVPRTAPGDAVTLTRVQRHTRFARARLASVEQPGPDRVDPPCPHYERDACGGCQLMHLSTAAQLRAKQRIVGDALRRLAKLDGDDPPIIEAPTTLRYRNKVTFAVGGGVIGLHRLGEAGRLFEVEQCLLIDPRLDALHQRVRGARHGLPRRAEQVVLRLDGDGGVHVVVRTAAGEGWGDSARFASLLPPGTRVWWHPADGAPRVVAGSNDPWPATVFEQVNPAVGRLVRQGAVDALAADPPEGGSGLAWDLYAGIGDTTRLLSARGFAVESVELDPRAVALAERIGPAGPRRLAGDVATLIETLGRPRVVVVNPPRAGVAESVATALASSGARRIAYVSCDPATLARDIGRMNLAYAVRDVTAFDQFPQTAHVETLAILERR